MGLIREVPSTDSAARALCVLGAGNCNDVDLAELASVFPMIHLVDIDRGAVTAASLRNPVAEDALRIHAPVDLSALHDVPTSLAARTGMDTSVQHGTHRERLSPMLPRVGIPSGQCTVVLSASVLSQLIATVLEGPGCGEGHVARALTLRRSHFHLMIELLAPGGTGILVAELTSSDHAPSLRSVPPGRLGRLLYELVRDGKFFPTMNPFAIVESDLRPYVRDRTIEDVRIRGPWQWLIDSHRSYLAYAITFRKALRTDSSDFT